MAIDSLDTVTTLAIVMIAVCFGKQLEAKKIILVNWQQPYCTLFTVLSKAVVVCGVCQCWDYKGHVVCLSNGVDRVPTC